MMRRFAEGIFRLQVRSEGARAEVHLTICAGRGWLVELKRVGTVRWRVRYAEGHLKETGWRRAAQSGARIGGGVLDTQARN